MTDDRTRKAILSRRAKFLAAALVTTLPACDREKEGIQPDTPKVSAMDAGTTATTATTTASASTAPPMPCLEIAEPIDAGPPPMPCLKIPPPTSDAGPKPHPHPCLKVSTPDF